MLFLLFAMAGYAPAVSLQSRGRHDDLAVTHFCSYLHVVRRRSQSMWQQQCSEVLQIELDQQY